MWPDIQREKLSPDCVGIRPKVKLKESLVEDFKIISKNENGLHHISLIGIESPSITEAFQLHDQCFKTTH